MAHTVSVNFLELLEQNLSQVERSFCRSANSINELKGEWLSFVDIDGVVLNMEHVENNFLTHQTLVVSVHGDPPIVPSLDGNGIQLNGLNQYLDAGKDIICKNNLDNCRRGFTLRFKMKLLQLADETYFISSAPIDVYYRYAVDGLILIFARISVCCKRAYAIAIPSVRLSVRLSVCLSHGWISQKLLKLGSCNFHHTVAPSL